MVYVNVLELVDSLDPEFLRIKVLYSKMLINIWTYRVILNLRNEIKSSFIYTELNH